MFPNVVSHNNTQIIDVKDTVVFKRFLYLHLSFVILLLNKIVVIYVNLNRIAILCYYFYDIISIIIHY